MNSRTIVAVIPAYNAGKFLKASVESLLAQTRHPDRIILIDDASTDTSISDIRSYEQEGLIEIVTNSRNLGKSESLNRVFDEVDADYFLIQDADDISFPERVERQLMFMESNPKIGCSSSFIEYIGSESNKIGKGQLDLLTENKLAEYLKSDEPFGLFCPAVILRAEVVKNPDLQFRGQFWPADDIDLWNRIAEAGWQVLAQPEVLVQYRIHYTSAVTRSFSRSRLQFEWVRASLRARRNGFEEPLLNEFLSAWNSVSFLAKMNRARKSNAKGLYRGGGFKICNGRRVSGILDLLTAFLLQPEYVGPRLITQLKSK